MAVKCCTCPRGVGVRVASGGLGVRADDARGGWLLPRRTRVYERRSEGGHIFVEAGPMNVSPSAASMHCCQPRRAFTTRSIKVAERYNKISFITFPFDWQHLGRT